MAGTPDAVLEGRGGSFFRGIDPNNGWNGLGSESFPFCSILIAFNNDLCWKFLSDTNKATSDQVSYLQQQQRVYMRKGKGSNESTASQVSVR